MSNDTIHFVSLGCPKNRVDTEIMLGIAESEGYTHVDEPADARVIVVNTCGFIDAAKRESVETILALAENKNTGRCEKLVVAGCLSQRYPDELARDMPEVDHFLGTGDVPRLGQVLNEQIDRVLVGSPADFTLTAELPRRLSTRGSSAYVKIAEGCNRSCAFCIIPALRGKQRSRPILDVLEEVEHLADVGIVEVNLVSQDTIAYGRDRDDGARLPELVRRIAEVQGLRWVRLHYLYPEQLSEELLELMAEHPKVLPYIDLPLQHAASDVLKRMRRPYKGPDPRMLIERLRETIPEVVLRTAFIVGHPGETPEAFEELCQLVRDVEFDRMGIFLYSDESGTASFSQDDKVGRTMARARARKLAALQRRISRAKNRKLVGQELTVLVEGESSESELVMIGRHAGQAPEIDGCVYLSGGPVAAGELWRSRVLGATDYDLHAEALTPLSPLPRCSAERRDRRRLSVVRG